MHFQLLPYYNWVGHTKAHAIAYIPGCWKSSLFIQGKILLGGVLTALTVAMQIYANHSNKLLYCSYTVIGVELYYRIKENDINDFLKKHLYSYQQL